MVTMPRKQIKRKCGHIENIYLEDREFNDPAALKHHEDFAKNAMCHLIVFVRKGCLMWITK